MFCLPTQVFVTLNPALRDIIYFDGEKTNKLKMP